MNTAFVEALMDHLIKETMIPKVQIERAVGPILSMFLADVLAETLSDDPILSGHLAMICPEFPLKKQSDNKSTNIDWLMYNTERKQLLFVELKTSDTSTNTGQNAIYRANQDAVKSKGGSFLLEDLEKMVGASTEHGKYRHILNEKVLPYKSQISACHDARIVYLVPKSMEHKIQGQADKVLTFGMLSNFITGSFAQEWSVIQRHLCGLDESSLQSRNRQSAPASKTGSFVNFEDITDLYSVIELCHKHGDAIIVGFAGGVVALESKSLPALVQRRYKWDNITAGRGKKDHRNWIPGSVFSRIIDQKKVHPNHP